MIRRAILCGVVLLVATIAPRVRACTVTSLSEDRNPLLAGQSLHIQWTTDHASDCVPAPPAAVSFEIDIDNTPVDTVPYNTFAYTIAAFMLNPPGYHVIRVKVSSCASFSTCNFCGGSCGFSPPGYVLQSNMQPLTVLTDPNCPTVSIDSQTETQAFVAPVSLVVATTPPGATATWFQMTRPDQDYSTQVDNFAGSTARYGGYYFAVVNSGCGSTRLSRLITLCVPPQIYEQPQSQTIAPGSATLHAAVSGTGITSMQWFAGNPGDSSHPIDSPEAVMGNCLMDRCSYSSAVAVPATSTQSFFVRATDTCGQFSDSAAATVSVSCPQMTIANVVMSWLGSISKCSPSSDLCTAGEPIAFGVTPFGYSFSCGTHRFSWDFGDGSTTVTSGQSVTHAFSAAGSYDVRVTINNGSQQLLLVQQVRVAKPSRRHSAHH